jgi:hypothetical protein
VATGVATLETKDPANLTLSIDKAKFKLGLTGQFTDQKVFDPKSFDGRKVGFSGRVVGDTINVDEVFDLPPIKKLPPHLYLEILGTVKRDGRALYLQVAKEKTPIDVSGFPENLKVPETKVLLRGMADIDDAGKINIVLYRMGKVELATAPPEPKKQ